MQIPLVLPTSIDLRKGITEFRKYTSTNFEKIPWYCSCWHLRSPQHFRSHMELNKFYLARTLRAAGIRKRREYDKIIVAG